MKKTGLIVLNGGPFIGPVILRADRFEEGDEEIEVAIGETKCRYFFHQTVMDTMGCEVHHFVFGGPVKEKSQAPPA